MTPACKHPVVKVVAREDDIEFVECQQCGEVFDSAEYVDIAIEEEEEEEALADHRPED
jgi:Zn ribbon nucleic-acid-binding protein